MKALVVPPQVHLRPLRLLLAVVNLILLQRQVQQAVQHLVHLLRQVQPPHRPQVVVRQVALQPIRQHLQVVQQVPRLLHRLLLLRPLQKLLVLQVQIANLIRHQPHLLLLAQVHAHILHQLALQPQVAVVHQFRLISMVQYYGQHKGDI